MIKVTQDQMIAAIKSGDIGLIKGSNFFALLQNMYRSKFREGDLKASHGFIVYNPPEIVEANGLFVSRGKFLKNIGNTTECRFFRYGLLTLNQLDAMLDYVDGMVDASGHYSVGGIVQFALQFIGIKKKLSDERGVFCTELTGKAIIKGGLPYIKTLPAYCVTPSLQLNWLMTEGGRQGWYLAAHYDGDGGYFIDDALAQLSA